MSTQAQPVRIFIAYSSKDLAFKEEIRKRLKPLLRAGKRASQGQEATEVLAQIEVAPLLLSGFRLAHSFPDK